MGDINDLNIMIDARDKRIAELNASMRHALKIEEAMRGIINHWNEFAEMMIENKTDYGLGERIDAASKLIKQ